MSILFSDNKFLRYITLCVPIIFAVFAVMGYGFFFRAAVSVSCAVILCLLPDKKVGYSIWLVIIALFVSIVGDWFMSHAMAHPSRFVYGICVFFIAHMGFLGFCLHNGRINMWILMAVLTGFLIIFYIVLRPEMVHVVLYVAVLAYLFISCFSLAAAVGLRLPRMARWYFVLGIALLICSDTIIALKVFAGYGQVNFLILPTYFASHILITCSLIRKN